MNFHPFARSALLGAALVLQCGSLLAGGVVIPDLSSAHLLAGPGTSPPPAGAVAMTPDLDSDNDGMPDWWESFYGFCPTNGCPPDANLDADGDGMSNLHEYLAGTDPLDPSSDLRIASFRRTSNVVTFRFQGVAGKSYAVQFTGSLTNTWTTLTNIATLPANANVQVRDTTNAPPRFYRVRLR